MVNGVVVLELAVHYGSLVAVDVVKTIVIISEIVFVMVIVVFGGLRLESI